MRYQAKGAKERWRQPQAADHHQRYQEGDMNPMEKGAGRLPPAVPRAPELEYAGAQHGRNGQEEAEFVAATRERPSPACP